MMRVTVADRERWGRAFLRAEARERRRRKLARARAWLVGISASIVAAALAAGITVSLAVMLLRPLATESYVRVQMAPAVVVLKPTERWP
jgi:hypothetical protein